MIQSLDFGKWLTRLGLKSQTQPPVIQSVQPVVLVGDHRHLVSEPLLCAYAIGGESVSANFNAIVVVTPVPLDVYLVKINATATAAAAMLIGGGAPPAVAGAVACTPQLMRPGFPPQAAWSLCNVAAAQPATVPIFGVGTNFDQELRHIVVPPGGFMLIQGQTGGTTMRITCLVHERPNELAQ